MKFIFDACFSDKLAKGLKAFEENVEHTSEFSTEGTLDLNLFPLVKRRKGILITKDIEIGRKPQEKQAIRDLNISVIFVKIPVTYERWDIIEFFIKKWRLIKRHASDASQPFAFRIKPNSIEDISSELHR
jgi:hypothetical protein